MKKLFFAAAVILGCLSFKAANAQVRVNVGLNIGSQPEWGPVGYDHADYYYFPDIDSYYDVNNHVYIYPSGNTWLRGEILPQKFRRNIDLYGSHKVVVNEVEPWRHADVYRTKYARYKGMRDQTIIRDSRDDHYREHYIERKPYNDKYGEDHDRGRDHGRDHDHDHDHDRDKHDRY